MAWEEAKDSSDNHLYLGLGEDNDNKLGLHLFTQNEDGTTFTQTDSDDLEIKQSKPPLFDFLCFRPFRQYEMGTGMLLKQGSDLGNTFRGWADFQMTDNIIAKTHIGHFTFWHASIVTNPKCLFLAEDIFCSNYLGGEGKEILDNYHIAHGGFGDNQIEMMRAMHADIVIYPIPIGSMEPKSNRCILNTPLSLTGQCPRTMPNCAPDSMQLGNYFSNHTQLLRYCQSEKQQWDTTRDIGSGIMEMLTDAAGTKQSPPKKPWDCFTMGSC